MAFSNPQKNIEQFGIAEGMHVADLGAGSGFYSIIAARRVGSEGLVYAVDIQRELLSRIKQEVASEELENLEVMWGDISKPGGTGLGDGSVDVAIVSNVLFQVDDIKSVFTEAYRILKPGGRMLVVEWTDSFGGLGPEENVIVTEQRTLEAVGSVGFSVSGNINAGDHHYGIIARKEKNTD